MNVNLSILHKYLAPKIFIIRKYTIMKQYSQYDSSSAGCTTEVTIIPT